MTPNPRYTRFYFLADAHFILSLLVLMVAAVAHMLGYWQWQVFGVIAIGGLLTAVGFGCWVVALEAK